MNNNNQNIVNEDANPPPQDRWMDLRECEKVWYMAYWAPIENNARVQPSDNDVCQEGWNWARPTALQLSCVQDHGDELVRTTHWRPTEEQRNALLFWIEQNPQ